jgi:hypothetical protein
LLTCFLRVKINALIGESSMVSARPIVNNTFNLPDHPINNAHEQLVCKTSVKKISRFFPAGLLPVNQENTIS